MMKTGTHTAFSLRASHLLSLAVLALMFAAPAWAQWPTTRWVVMESPVDNFINQARGLLNIGAPPAKPVGERAKIAEKHQKMLEAASRRFQTLGFPAPLQITT